MKKFKRFILFFLSIVLMLNLLIRLFIPTKSDLYFAPIKDLKKSRIIVFGDSHTQNAWAKSKSKDILDMSFEGDNVIDIERKINFLERNHYLDSTELVVLPIEPHIFSKYRLDNNQNSYSETFFAGNTTYAYLTYYLPFIYDARLKFDLYRLLKGKFEINTNKCKDGILHLESASDSNWIQQRIMTIYPTSKVEYPLISSYSRIIKLLDQKKIRVLFVKYPVSAYFNLLSNQNKNLITIERKVDSFCSTNNIEILNLIDLIQENKYFFNGDHLNCDGSEIFVQEMKTHINIRF